MLTTPNASPESDDDHDLRGAAATRPTPPATLRDEIALDAADDIDEGGPDAPPAVLDHPADPLLGESGSITSQT